MGQQGILEPVIQYGFAGLSVVLLAFVFWLTRTLIGVLQRTGEIIQANTAAIRSLSEQTRDELKLLRELREALLKRPCLLKEE